MNQDYNKLADAYKVTFGTESGRTVLEDLMAAFHYETTTFKTGMRDEYLIAEGQRTVVLYIKGLMKYNPNQSLTEEGDSNE